MWRRDSGHGDHLDLLFTGFYEHTIDAKNRLAVPAEIRELLVPRSATGEPLDRPVHLYVTLGEDQSLCIYTEQGFQKRADQLDHSELDPAQVLEHEEMIFGLARRVELDSAGRIRLPDQLLTMSGLTSEVVLIGVKDHLKVKDRGGWLQKVQAVRANRPELLRDSRYFMKPGRPDGGPQGTTE